MTPSLFFSLLAVLLPLTGALPGHDHSHAHVHRDFHNNIQRDHGHGHAHVHRDALDVQPAVEPRASPTPGCGRKPKEEGSGTGTESSLSSPLPSGSSTSLGGIFALKNAEVVTVTTTTDIVIEPVVVWTSVTVTTYIGVETVAVDPNSTPTTSSTTTTSSDSSTSSTTISSTSATSTSSVEALKTQDIAAQAAVASSSSSILQAFQSSHTLATLTTSTSVNIPTTPITTPLTTETTSTSEAATVTAGAGAGGVSTGDVDYLTVVVRNMMTDTLTTSHAMNADLPANIMAITATLTDGTMTPGATASMIFPSGWAGNMVAAKAATSEDEVVDLADGSLIEGSFVVQTGDTPVNDMDVSYVYVLFSFPTPLSLFIIRGPRKQQSYMHNPQFTHHTKLTFKNKGAASLSPSAAAAKKIPSCSAATLIFSLKANAPTHATVGRASPGQHAETPYVSSTWLASRPLPSFCPARAKPSHGHRTTRIARIRNAQATTSAAALAQKRTDALPPPHEKRASLGWLGGGVELSVRLRSLGAKGAAGGLKMGAYWLPRWL